MIITIFSCRSWYGWSPAVHPSAANRDSVSAIIVLQLVFLHRESIGPVRDDLSLGYWRSAVCEQVVQSLAIVTTSLPYAKMLMQSLDSGMMRVDDTRRRGGDYSKGSSGRAYELLDVSRDSAKQKQAAQKHKADSERTRHIAISQTKTWTVKREPATRSDMPPESSSELTVPEFLKHS